MWFVWFAAGRCLVWWYGYGYSVLGTLVSVKLMRLMRQDCVHRTCVWCVCVREKFKLFNLCHFIVLKYFCRHYYTWDMGIVSATPIWYILLLQSVQLRLSNGDNGTRQQWMTRNYQMIRLTHSMSMNFCVLHLPSAVRPCPLIASHPTTSESCAYWTVHSHPIVAHILENSCNKNILIKLWHLLTRTSHIIRSFHLSLPCPHEKWCV